ncbi:MAG: sulfite exporter TauE/SafE family protein, partial [Thermodesulfobacteriota bacterium]
MTTELANLFIPLDLAGAFQVILLGFIGGVLSGFIGSGGAFFMTPGMMNLGVNGVVSVASNITHKFGKAMMGSKKHGEMGNVDKRLGLFMLITALIGIRLAVWINSLLFHGGGDGHGTASGAGANLYISAVFIGILTLVALSMIRDLLKNTEEGTGPSKKISEYLSRLKIPPFITFKVADVKISLWVILPVGLVTGYLAGTIGVGGFVGVPSMIYIFGVPTAVAAGTELYLAMFMGAWGAVNYAWEGFVDIRLTVLLLSGSLFGVYLGAYGVKVVSERYIRMVTCLIILLCVVSRAIAVPMYLRQLGFLDINPAWDSWFNNGSKFL